MLNYECVYCPYATLEAERMREHLRGAHGLGGDTRLEIRDTSEEKREEAAAEIVEAVDESNSDADEVKER
jgi:hypothetical protein